MHEKIDSLCDSTLEFSLLWSFMKFNCFTSAHKIFIKQYASVMEGQNWLPLCQIAQLISIETMQGPDLKFYPSKP